MKASCIFEFWSDPNHRSYRKAASKEPTIGPNQYTQWPSKEPVEPDAAHLSESPRAAKANAGPKLRAGLMPVPQGDTSEMWKPWESVDVIDAKYGIKDGDSNRIMVEERCGAMMK